MLVFGHSMAVIIALLGLGHLLDVLAGMLLQQPPLLQKDMTSNPKGLPRYPPYKGLDLQC